MSRRPWRTSLLPPSAVNALQVLPLFGALPYLQVKVANIALPLWSVAVILPELSL